MIIGIDASRANKIQKTGTEWYSYYLIQELKKLDKKNHYFLYSKEPLRGALGDLPANFESKVLSWPPKFLWTQFRLSLEMFRNSPDLLFVPAHTIPLLHPRKTVTTCHDIGFERFPELYSNLELHYHRFGMRLAVKKAVKIIVPSEFTKKEMVEVYGADPKKFVVIYHGYDQEVYKIRENIPLAPFTKGEFGGVATAAPLSKGHVPSFVNDRSRGIREITEPFILYIGRLEKKKNTAGLIETFNVILRHSKHDIMKNLKLVLVGGPGYGFEEVKEKIKKYNLEDRVIMPGWLGGEELAVLLNAAELFVFPSFYEGFGLPILEAMACNCPVAASRLSSIPEVGGEAIEYFDPYNIQDMADKIAKVLLDKNRREELRKRGLERVKEFSWEKCARETLEVLEGI
jgi:glycosyltransferase involved in cell wall biosynthesis